MIFNQFITNIRVWQTDGRIYTGAVYSFARGSAMLVVDEVGWLVGDVVGTMKVLILIVLTGALLVDLTSGEGEGDTSGSADASKESTTKADKDGGDNQVYVPEYTEDDDTGGKGNGTDGNTPITTATKPKS